MQRSFILAGSRVQLLYAMYRGLESLPTPSGSAKVVCLSIFLQGISFVVIHVFRHESISKYRDVETPTHRCLVMILAGVIVAGISEISIDGDSMFTNNSGAEFGGEKGRRTCIQLNIFRRSSTAEPSIAGKSALLSSSDIYMYIRRRRSTRKIGCFIFQHALGIEKSLSTPRTDRPQL